MTHLRRALARRLRMAAYRVDPSPRTVTARLCTDTTALTHAVREQMRQDERAYG